MSEKSAIRAEANRLRALFEAQGAEVFEANVLQPAGALLDLYGEDIRARAFVTQDPLRGEMMLRPDFTVPLVQRHMGEGRGPGRYTYAGEVFRRQEDHPDRTAEYLQVGFELFNGGDAPAADAEVFATIAGILAPLGLRAAMGDIGLLRAAIEGLRTSERRKARLLHHLWRPVRFKALLTAFSADTPPRPEAAPGVEIGLRTSADIKARLARLADDRAAPLLSTEETRLIDALLSVGGKAPAALAKVKAIAADLPAIQPAVDMLSARFEALEARNIGLDTIDFEASYGRTTLEYYDGFVFGFYAAGHPELPPVATGGRYDALTRAIGGGTSTPAVGGVIRPSIVLELGGAS